MSSSNHSPSAAAATDPVAVLIQPVVESILRQNFDAVSLACLVTVLKLLDNVLQKPYEAKFRIVKLGNATVQTKIVNCHGGVVLLNACGFVNDDKDAMILTLPEHSIAQQDFLVAARHLVARYVRHELGGTPQDLPPYRAPPPPPLSRPAATATTSATTTTFNPYQGQRYDGLSAAAGVHLGPEEAQYTSRTEVELQRLQQQQQRLEAQLHHAAPISRDWTVLALPGQVVLRPGTNHSSSKNNNTNTPDDTTSTPSSDGALLAQRAQTLMLQQQQQQQQGFTTRAMRQVEKLQKLRVYSHALLQIQFPDGSKCCGKFAPHETIQTVLDALRDDCLVLNDSNNNNNNNMDYFELLVPPLRRPLPRTSRLQDEGLVPAAKLFVSWNNHHHKNSLGGGKVPTTPWQPHLVLAATTSGSSSTPTTTVFPEAHALVNNNNNNHNSTTTSTDPSSSTTTSSGNQREEDLLKRMMGGTGGRKKKASTSSSTTNPTTKPKWFQG